MPLEIGKINQDCLSGKALRQFNRITYRISGQASKVDFDAYLNQPRMLLMFKFKNHIVLLLINCIYIVTYNTLLIIYYLTYIVVI